MEDEQILQLFWDRSEQAIDELGKKYEKLCYGISYRILNNHEDAEECVSDAYRVVWDSVPPTRPASLPAYLSRIVRNVSLTRYQKNTAQKRNSVYEVSLEELGEMLPAENNVEAALEAKELAGMIEDFLAQLDQENRVIFVLRYAYLENYEEIAKRTGLSKKNVSVRLVRLRKRLREYLNDKGVLV